MGACHKKQCKQTNDEALEIMTELEDLSDDNKTSQENDPTIKKSTEPLLRGMCEKNSSDHLKVFFDFKQPMNKSFYIDAWIGGNRTFGRKEIESDICKEMGDFSEKLVEQKARTSIFAKKDRMLENLRRKSFVLRDNDENADETKFPDNFNTVRRSSSVLLDEIEESDSTSTFSKNSHTDTNLSDICQDSTIIEDNKKSQSQPIELEDSKVDKDTTGKKNSSYIGLVPAYVGSSGKDLLDKKESVESASSLTTGEHISEEAAETDDDGQQKEDDITHEKECGKKPISYKDTRKKEESEECDKKPISYKDTRKKEESEEFDKKSISYKNTRKKEESEEFDKKPISYKNTRKKEESEECDKKPISYKNTPSKEIKIESEGDEEEESTTDSTIPEIDSDDFMPNDCYSHCSTCDHWYYMPERSQKELIQLKQKYPLCSKLIGNIQSSSRKKKCRVCRQKGKEAYTLPEYVTGEKGWDRCNGCQRWVFTPDKDDLQVTKLKIDRQKFPFTFSFFSYYYPSDVDDRLLPFRRHGLARAVKGIKSKLHKDIFKQQFGDAFVDRRILSVERKTGTRIALCKMGDKLIKGLPRRKIVIFSPKIEGIHQALTVMEHLLPDVMETALFNRPVPGCSSRSWTSSKSICIRRHTSFIPNMRRSCNMLRTPWEMNLLPHRIVPPVLSDEKMPFRSSIYRANALANTCGSNTFQAPSKTTKRLPETKNRPI